MVVVVVAVVVVVEDLYGKSCMTSLIYTYLSIK